MTDMQQHEKQGEEQKDQREPAEQVLFHLLRHPYDLVDARRLMRRFHASAADVSCALSKFELYVPQPAEEPGR